MTCDKCGRSTLDDFGGKFSAVHLAVGEHGQHVALTLERDEAEIRMSIVAPGVRIEIPNLDRFSVVALARMFADVESEVSKCLI